MPTRQKVEEVADIIDLFGRDYLKDMDWLRRFNYRVISSSNLKRLKSMYMKYAPLEKVKDVKNVDKVVTRDSAPYVIGMLNNLIKTRSELYGGSIIGRMMEEMPDRLPERPRHEKSKQSEWDE